MNNKILPTYNFKILLIDKNKTKKKKKSWFEKKGFFTTHILSLKKIC